MVGTKSCYSGNNPTVAGLYMTGNKTMLNTLLTQLRHFSAGNFTLMTCLRVTGTADKEHAPVLVNGCMAH
jgi:hypothetical protein